MIFGLFKWIPRLFLISIIGLCSTIYMYNAKAAQSVPVKIKLRNGKYKIVQVNKVDLTQQERMQLAYNIKMTLQNTDSPHLKSSHLPSKIELGMNHVPVFDEGMWGTCATFATTAALDALFSLHGEQKISQTCNLAFGRTIRNPDSRGGWEGSLNSLVLQQIAHYGYLPLFYEHTNGCGGLKQYPVVSNDNGSPMSYDEFTRHSIKTLTKNNWRQIESMHRLKPQNPMLGEQSLTQVKQALSNGHRVLIGALLDIEVGVGAFGQFDNVDADAWVLMKGMVDDLNNHANHIGGHALLITGYDDNACASYKDKDNKLHKQCGILHLRNSWSTQAGDNGDYYMTYDYFDTMALEAVEVR